MGNKVLKQVDKVDAAGNRAVDSDLMAGEADKEVRPEVIAPRPTIVLRPEVIAPRLNREMARLHRRHLLHLQMSVLRAEVIHEGAGTSKRLSHLGEFHQSRSALPVNLSTRRAS